MSRDDFGSLPRSIAGTVAVIAFLHVGIGTIALARLNLHLDHRIAEAEHTCIALRFEIDREYNQTCARAGVDPESYLLAEVSNQGKSHG